MEIMTMQGWRESDIARWQGVLSLVTWQNQTSDLVRGRGRIANGPVVSLALVQTIPTLPRAMVFPCLQHSRLDVTVWWVPPRAKAASADNRQGAAPWPWLRSGRRTRSFWWRVWIMLLSDCQSGAVRGKHRKEWFGRVLEVAHSFGTLCFEVMLVGVSSEWKSSWCHGSWIRSWSKLIVKKVVPSVTNCTGVSTAKLWGRNPFWEIWTTTIWYKIVTDGKIDLVGFLVTSKISWYFICAHITTHFELPSVCKSYI